MKKLWKVKEEFKELYQDVLYDTEENIDTTKYNDVDSDIILWSTFGNRITSFITSRNKIRVLMNSVGYSNLSGAEKDVCARLKLVDRTTALLRFNDIDELINIWTNTINTIMLERQGRVDRLVGVFWAYLENQLDINDIETETEVLAYNYLHKGLLSEEYHGYPGILDYFAGTSIYESENPNFMSKEYATEEIRDKVIAILVE